MDRFSFLNAAHIEFIGDLYDQYVQYPDSIEPSWKAFFQGYDFANATYDGEPLFAPAAQSAPARASQSVQAVVNPTVAAQVPENVATSTTVTRRDESGNVVDIKKTHSEVPVAPTETSE